ncbi:MAG: DMT family transporter [Planktotalea sp.]
MARLNAPTLGGLGGLLLIVLYCCFATGADAITRSIAQGFAAPQLYCFSGGIVALLSIAGNGLGQGKRSFISKRPLTLALRSALFILSSVFYFFAFRGLAFAEVFIFIALVPIFAGLLSGPILGESVRWQSWLALIAGAGGMLLLYPQGTALLTLAHLSALMGAMSGAGAMVLARHISRDDSNALLQVLYPNLTMFVVMGCILPFVYKPMVAQDMILIGLYASLLFLARWVLVLALTRIKAYVVTLLMNMQFVAMVIAGAVFFDETPGLNLFAGVAIIILAGAYVFLEQMWSDIAKKQQKIIRFGPPHIIHSASDAMHTHGVAVRPISFTLRS